MKIDIQIIDRGRGPQLSTSRITVQDVLPYLQQQYTPEQIREIMPVLTLAEIDVIQQYIRDHREAVLERDRQIRERAAARQRPGEEERERQERKERIDRARQMIQRSKQERNGELARTANAEDAHFGFGQFKNDSVSPAPGGFEKALA